MLSNCGSDEYGGAYGGQAGDQTGREYRLIPWYDGNWTHVFRYPNKQAQNLIARLAIQAALNDLIGYDQSQRLTFWQHLKASDYDPSKITIACETDCSASTAAILKAVGIRLDIDDLANIDPSMSTWTEVEELENAGLTVFTDSNHLNGYNLEPGDVLLKYGHTTIYVGSGDLADFPMEDDMPSVEDVWNYEDAMKKLDAALQRSNEIADQLKNVLAVVNKPSQVISFGGEFHRLYNAVSQKHIYTNNSEDVRSLTDAGWNDEGVLFTLNEACETNSSIIYMMINESGDTLLTQNIDEARICSENGWATCGAIGYSGDHHPIYRLYNPFTGAHLYTASKDEYDMLVGNGWSGEDVIFYSA